MKRSDGRLRRLRREGNADAGTDPALSGGRRSVPSRFPPGLPGRGASPRVLEAGGSVASVTDPQLTASLERLNDPLAESLRALARRLYGRASRQTVEPQLAVIDLPQGAIRGHLVSCTPI